MSYRNYIPAAMSAAGKMPEENMRTFSQKLTEMTKELGKEILSKKQKLVLGGLISAILFILSCHYLFEGLNKRFVIYTGLCLMTGGFIILPRFKRWYLALPAVLFYLVYVPRKMFFRIELPCNDLSGLIPAAVWANVLIILLLYALFLILFQRTRFAFMAGGIVLLFLTLINYYCVQFRGIGLSFTDLTAVGTAMTVLDNYRLTMSSELWYTILYFCFFISFGSWCDIPLKGKKYHLAVTAVSLGCGLCFWYFWSVSDYMEKNELHGHYWNAVENQKLNGFLLSFGISIKESGMEKPAGYSEKKLLEIARFAEESYQAPEVPKCNPSIIFIMNEAWSDLRVMGNLETTEDYMPFVDGLTDSAVKGNTYVEVLGGLTANSEFEALTGDSLAFLAPTAIPYSLQVDHDMNSLARVLKEQGYQTMAMHPSGPAAWNRENVYQYFGFDEFIDASEFQTPYLYVRSFISDECNFNEIIWQYEHKDEGSPLFLFDVTIQNHADYYGEIDMPISIRKVGDTPAEEAGYLYNAETYVNLMKITDDAFAEMLAYFETVEEPVIICMYGDHQPNLGDDFYNAMFAGGNLTEEEQTALKYVTPYVIWANYDVDFPEYGDISANYLGAVLLECAGVELPPYYQFLLQLQKQYPVITHRTIKSMEDEEPIVQYRMLQYNQLLERKYKEELFSTVP